MKSIYRCLIVSAVLLFVIQFACNDNNVVGPNKNLSAKWYGQLSEDFVHSILKSDGKIWSWGSNSSGTLGNGTNKSSDFPVLATNLNNIISIDQSYGAAVAVDKYGSIWFWGNLYIYFGLPDEDTNVVTPIKIAKLESIEAITISGIFIFLLGNDGTTWYIKMDWYSPTIIEGPNIIKDIPKISSIWKNLAITCDGLIYDLLSRDYVQTTLTNLSEVSGNRARHVLALKNDGTVWAWGNNDLGQLGNGTLERSELPTQVLNLTNIIAISANYDFNLALKEDGTVWFWGYEGQSGDSLVSQNVPIRIEPLSDAVLICSGYENLAMAKDGVYWIFNVKDKIPSIVLFNSHNHL